MITVYIVLIGVLFLLAISDLIVGVSNDAVNFLNSAIGSKAAPFKIIMLVAAVGILVGATFSGGMMEVARKGIFHPQQFYFAEIIIIFLAVMITDVILLDLFNTYGLPTSTTVSIVFELLGAAVAVSIIKIYGMPEGSKDISVYINSGKALGIISGILLSVVIAFSVGAIVQYITRIIFTFNYKKRLNYFGGLWGGFAITAIIYFILIKGAKGATFMSDETQDFIHNNSNLILTVSFISWSLLLQILHWAFKFNILKLIVLVGTFALAMAFAGNDLVNFIGVPLAGFESFKAFIAQPGADADQFLMTSLQASVKTPTFYLLMAGAIMVLTLWFSKKARNVVKTTLDLSRQTEGVERFGSSGLSRSIVRASLNFGKTFSNIVPEKIKTGIEKQFEPLTSEVSHSIEDAPAFDMIRASVNLVVASILISFATSLKLPLSTTYVTFMVAMGSSLSDKAWGRESAVYRITGVLSVIGGWFFTALSAFTLAFIMALIFSYAGIFGIALMVAIAIITVYRTHRIHKNRETKKELTNQIEDIGEKNIVQRCNLTVSTMLVDVNNYYQEILDGIIAEDLKQVKKVMKDIKKLNIDTKELKNSLSATISRLNEDSIESGHYYVQVIDYLRELAHNITYISNPCHDHLNNNHKSLIDVQIEELMLLKEKVNELLMTIQAVILKKEYQNIDQIIIMQHELIEIIASKNKKQIKRIKRMEVGTKNSLLYLAILSETKNLLLNAINLLKSQRDFTKYHEKKNLK
ncbi:MAG: phosphate permease [Bacteroidetes bacterium HGW-Bacteroidetes-17]|jgi:phosphate/sulfate permease|nr:MAG: phosphate permease [Bacteroidetes bacterium HGW-Bacteroidetes-17]